MVLSYAAPLTTEHTSEASRRRNRIMLQSVTVRNFAYFKDTQKLTFDQGPYFLVGENDSGKTSLFEIIRGCMSASKITHLTKPHDRDKPSIAMCCFNNPNIKNRRTVSAIIRSRWGTNHDDGDIYLKLVQFYPIGQDTATVEGEFLIASATSRDDFIWHPVSSCEREKILALFNPDAHVSDDGILEIAGCVERYRQSEANQTNFCEEQLKSHINKTTVVTLPMRGLSACQWTKSKTSNQAGHTNTEEIRSNQAGHTNAEEISSNQTGHTYAEEITSNQAGHTYAEEISSNQAGHTYAEEISSNQAGHTNAEEIGSNQAGHTYTEEITSNQAGHTNAEEIGSNQAGHTYAEEITSNHAGHTYAEEISSDQAGHTYAEEISSNQAGHTNAEEITSNQAGHTNTEEISSNQAGHTNAEEISTNHAGHTNAEEITSNQAGHTYAEKITSNQAGHTDAEEISSNQAGHTNAEEISSNQAGHTYAEEISTNQAGHTNAEEIITWYLRNLEEHQNKKGETKKPSISTQEKDREREYFRLITNNSGFEFSYEKGKLVIKNTAFHEPDSSILTIPEGVYEAKKLAVLLAVERFQTVCLEEPDRGMHPQMIVRIRDLVLPRVKPGKVILVITHNTSFLTALTLSQVYLFKRHFDGPRCTSCVTPLLSENDVPPTENVDKTLRLLTSGSSPLLFFANKVLLVEGEDDFIFVSNLKQYLLTQDKLLETYVAIFNDPDLQNDETIMNLDLQEFKQFLCSLHILPLGGEANKFRFNNFCKRIGLLTYFLMDEDALTRNIPGQKPNTDSPEGFLRLFGLDHDDDTCQKVKKDVRVLEQHRVFIWRGTIENAAAALAEKEEAASDEEKKAALAEKKEAALAKKKEAALAEKKEAALDKTEEAAFAEKEEAALAEKEEAALAEKEEAALAEKEEAALAEKEELAEKKEAALAEKKESLKQFYRSNNVILEYKNLNTGKKTRTKIFSDKKLTNQNIRNVVEKIVEVSKEGGSEFHRLIIFLMKMKCQPAK